MLGDTRIFAQHASVARAVQNFLATLSDEQVAALRKKLEKQGIRQKDGSITLKVQTSGRGRNAQLIEIPINTKEDLAEGYEAEMDLKSLQETFNNLVENGLPVFGLIRGNKLSEDDQQLKQLKTRLKDSEKTEGAKYHEKQGFKEIFETYVKQVLKFISIEGLSDCQHTHPVIPLLLTAPQPALEWTEDNATPKLTTQSRTLSQFYNMSLVGYSNSQKLNADYKQLLAHATAQYLNHLYLCYKKEGNAPDYVFIFNPEAFMPSRTEAKKVATKLHHDALEAALKIAQGKGYVKADVNLIFADKRFWEEPNNVQPDVTPFCERQLAGQSQSLKAQCFSLADKCGVTDLLIAQRNDQLTQQKKDLLEKLPIMIMGNSFAATGNSTLFGSVHSNMPSFACIKDQFRDKFSKSVSSTVYESFSALEESLCRGCHSPSVRYAFWKVHGEICGELGFKRNCKKLAMIKAAQEGINEDLLPLIGKIYGEMVGEDDIKFPTHCSWECMLQDELAMMTDKQKCDLLSLDSFPEYQIYRGILNDITKLKSVYKSIDKIPRHINGLEQEEQVPNLYPHNMAPFNVAQKELEQLKKGIKEKLEAINQSFDDAQELIGGIDQQIANLDWDKNNATVLESIKKSLEEKYQNIEKAFNQLRKGVNIESQGQSITDQNVSDFIEKLREVIQKQQQVVDKAAKPSFTDSLSNFFGYTGLCYTGQAATQTGVLGMAESRVPEQEHSNQTSWRDKIFEPFACCMGR